MALFSDCGRSIVHITNRTRRPQTTLSIRNKIFPIQRHTSGVNCITMRKAQFIKLTRWKWAGGGGVGGEGVGGRGDLDFQKYISEID